MYACAYQPKLTLRSLSNGTGMGLLEWLLLGLSIQTDPSRQQYPPADTNLYSPCLHLFPTQLHNRHMKRSPLNLRIAFRCDIHRCLSSTRPRLITQVCVYVRVRNVFTNKN